MSLQHWSEKDLGPAVDSALHVAKTRGGNQVVVFDGSMHDEQRSKLNSSSIYMALWRETTNSVLPVSLSSRWVLGRLLQ
jgi:hypothetical protein